jgi:hypothetical protein
VEPFSNFLCWSAEVRIPISAAQFLHSSLHSLNTLQVPLSLGIGCFAAIFGLVSFNPFPQVIMRSFSLSPAAAAILAYAATTSASPIPSSDLKALYVREVDGDIYARGLDIDLIERDFDEMEVERRAGGVNFPGFSNTLIGDLSANQNAELSAKYNAKTGSWVESIKEDPTTGKKTTSSKHVPSCIFCFNN